MLKLKDKRNVFWSLYGIIGIILLLPSQNVQAANTVEYLLGLMKVHNGTNNSTTDVCFTYPSKYFAVPTELSKPYAVKDLRNIDICNETGINHETFSSSNDTIFLMDKYSDCNLSLYFDYVRDNASGIILISDNRYYLNQSYNLEAFVIITNKSSQDLPTYPSNDMKVQFITVEEKSFNPSTLILWFVACLCVIIGAYTGPYREIPSTSSEQQILDSGSSSASKQQVSLNVIVVVVLVVFISSTLLLLYFFYKYLVYFFMFVFCVASARASYDVLLQILNLCKMNLYMPKIRNFGIHQILLSMVCVAVPIIWFVFRHKTLGWILQDYLGICFCIHLIQTLRMPNLKVCTVFLTLLFIYDIFFVFITPYFTKDGQSVMVEVATGGTSGEDLPLLLKIPQLETNILSVCSSPRFSLLGFGDIIIPGFLVCFAHTFDIINGDTKRRPYFITAVLGYGLGLALAFVVLMLTQTGQPALLYIVPAVLIPIYTVAMCKKQVKVLWTGQYSAISAA